jgi:signal transduction histidine kinase
LSEVLDIAVREARRLTQTQVGAIFLPDHDNLILAALSSDCAIDIEPGYRISLTQSITGTVFRTSKSQLVTNVSEYSLVDPNAVIKARLGSLLAVPLLSGVRTIGVLSVGNKVGGELCADDERLLTMMVPSVVIALENVRIYEQASEIAVAAERGRLARDLHDSVTQTLFAASLTAEVLPRIWSRDPNEGMIRLEKLREFTRGALAEMRTLLLELRPEALADMPMDDLLHQLAEGIAGRTCIHISVDILHEPDIPSDVKTALYRIAQEALNNVAKHSRAQTAHVILTQTAHHLELSITDDGRGFDPEINRANHLGLHIMAERAAAIKAILNIHSAINQGTRVSVLWSGQEQ